MLRSLVEQNSKVEGTRLAIEAELKGELEDAWQQYEDLKTKYEANEFPTGLIP